MSEEIGRHKGSIETLLHEKKELSRILQIVDAQLEKHLEALEEKGVDTDKFIDSLMEEDTGSKKDREAGNSRRKSNRSNTTNQRKNSGSGNRDGRDFSPSR